MSFGESSDSGFKKFVSQDEIDKARQKRQEEWDKVRKPDDPEEAPEEKHDPRSLYEQLQANKSKSDEDYEERMRLSNQVQGLDEGESDFLDYVSQKKEEITKRREQENEDMLQEVREAMVNKVVDKTQNKTEKKSTKPLPVGSSQSKSQTSLLAGAIKRKTSEKDEVTQKKQKAASSSENASSSSNPTVCSPSEVSQVVGILPGIGDYSDSDSEDTSGSEDDTCINTDIFPKLVKCQPAQECSNAH